jgi:hypothetical protein
MKKLSLILLVCSMTLAISAQAKLKEPGQSDPGDIIDQQAEINRQNEEAQRMQDALNARTKNKMREIEERAINLLLESENSNQDNLEKISELDKIELGDVIVDQVLAFKNEYKIKLKNALIEKKYLREESAQDQILKNIKI